MTDPAHADALTVPATPRGQAWIREQIAQARREALEEAKRRVGDLRGADVPKREAEDTGEAYDLAIDHAQAAIRAFMDKEPPHDR